MPSILHIQTKKPPNTNEILPTILIVSGAFDDVICIALFGVFLGLTFSRGTHLALAIAEGPIEVALGLTYGVVVGVVLWYLPSARTVSCELWTYIILYLGLVQSVGIIIQYVLAAIYAIYSCIPSVPL